MTLLSLGLGLAMRPAFPATQPLEVIVWNRVANVRPLMSLLVYAMAATVDEFGPYEFTVSKPMEQGRAIRELETNRAVNVMVVAPNKERELNLLPVRIPATKGLLGHRVCLIRKGDQKRFSDINSLEDWINSGLTIGQGTHWPDTPILEANGIGVVKSPSYRPLFNMLARERFDCFARSVNEVLPELAQHGHKGMEIENHLLFYYPLPHFFFISKRNPELAERIEIGLRRGLASGFFEQHIERHFGPAMEHLKLNKRIVIRLENPFLTKETRRLQDDPKIWLDPAR